MRAAQARTMAGPSAKAVASAACSSWSDLPDDNVVTIARECNAPTLLLCESLCSGWRVALRRAKLDLEEVWKALALARFPRLDAVLRLSSGPPPSYRVLFRNQLEAERSHAAQEAEQKTTLDDFIFSVELRHGTEVEGRWTGTINSVDGSENAVLADGSKPRLWTEGSEPRWIDPEGEPVSRHIQLMVFVTHKFHTIKIYQDAWCCADFDEEEGAWEFDFVALPQRFGANFKENAYGDEMLCELKCNLCITGEVELRFKVDDEATAMDTDELRGYLEDMLPWPVSALA